MNDSRLVGGVYASKPGVLLVDKGIEGSLARTVPLGVMGIVPTKVCDEGGAIRPGDLLVTSSREGHAMKGDRAKLEFGVVLGKAIEAFDAGSSETGLVKVFVNVR